MLIPRSNPQEPSGFKRSRLTLKWKRAKKKKDERVKREHMENELAEQNRQAQEEAESDLAKVLGERA